MELWKACKQWMKRPADERFWSIEEAMAETRKYYEDAIEKEVPYDRLRVRAVDDEIRLDSVYPGIPNARFSNYAFGQLCRRGTPSAPPSYLRQLPATLAAQNLNHSLKAKGDHNEKQANLLIHHVNGGGDHLLRATVSDAYSRLWNYELFGRLNGLDAGWKVPPSEAVPGDPRRRQATAADLMESSSIREGDWISPGGIYASDHDMFVFMVNDERRITDELSRGFFLWNSEVGDKSFGFCSFLFNHSCANHIIYKANNVIEVRIRHVGRVRNRAFSRLMMEVRKYADSSVSDELATIEKAKQISLGKSKEEVVSVLLGISKKKRIDLTRPVLNSAYGIAEEYTDRYGNPNSLWASVNGITQYSQSVPYADTRTNLDRAAGKLLTMVN